MKLAALALVLSTGSLTWFTATNDTTEHQAVERACLDYVEGIYQVQPERIAQSVHPELRKTGFGRWGEQTEYQSYPMTYDELYALAGTWNKDGSKAGPDAPRKVEILDVLDQTATAKLTAAWGIDYFHLAKYEGRWKIINVLWQTHPPESASRDEGQH